ncbi:ATP-binding protein, partial [Chromobacterium piscinae]
RIELAARHDGDKVRITVTDDGPGLPASMEHRAFDKFTRGAPESTTPGVGLGLAICRAIIENHGGTIEAGNVRPHGARFCFTLPAGAPPALPPDDA